MTIINATMTDVGPITLDEMAELLDAAKALTEAAEAQEALALQATLDRDFAY